MRSIKLPGIRFGLVLSALLVGLALAGCKKKETPPVSPASPPPRVGSFEAQVDGALEDSLSGPALAVKDSTGRLTNLEFDRQQAPQEGLSFELAPVSSGTRTYAVSELERPGNSTRAAAVAAYMRLRDHGFVARAGSLHVTRANSDSLAGTFRLTMRGVVNPSSDDWAIVFVSGSFQGIRAGSRSDYRVGRQRRSRPAER